MRIVVQRSRSASVRVDGRVVGAIDRGLVVLVGVKAGDTEADAAYLADKVVHLRIFEDDSGKMNRDVLETGGAVLSVSQFTLLGDVRKGRRPNYMAAAPPEAAHALWERFNERLRGFGLRVETGVFGANMEVSLVNDGPVTILLDSERLF
ncbi:MAG: D-tyrosyl-tRNA(Tyr) deacylase [Alicyclobacillaceae bacterium]|nr:D-tyrosyl-tRNA(Tyr) deacylase [Alicyclobacillaceae bacterium]